MAQRVELVSPCKGTEATETATRDVLEENSLDWILRAEPENLVEARFERLRHQDDPHTPRSAGVGGKRPVRFPGGGTR